MDATSPLRAAASGYDYFPSNVAGGQGTVALELSPLAGDLVVSAGNRDQRGATMSISPIEAELYNGNAGASFTAVIGLDADVASGSYPVSMTSTSTEKERIVAAALVIASAGGGVEVDDDLDDDGYSDRLEAFLGTDANV